MGQVDRFGYGVVRMLLKGSLHTYMPIRGYVMGGYEHSANVFGYLRHILDTAPLGNLIHEVLTVETAFPGHLFEIWIDFQQLVVIHDIAHETQREQRFNAAGTPGQNTQGAGGGNGGGCGIAILGPGALKNALTVVFKNAPLFGKITRSFMGRFLDETHHSFGGFKGLLGVIGYLQLVEHIGKPHHAQSDFAVAAHHGGNFRQRIFGHINGVVQKTNRQGDQVF